MLDAQRLALMVLFYCYSISTWNFRLKRTKPTQEKKTTSSTVYLSLDDEVYDFMWQLRIPAVFIDSIYALEHRKFVAENQNKSG